MFSVLFVSNFASLVQHPWWLQSPEPLQAFSGGSVRSSGPWKLQCSSCSGTEHLQGCECKELLETGRHLGETETFWGNKWRVPCQTFYYLTIQCTYTLPAVFQSKGPSLIKKENNFKPTGMWQIHGDVSLVLLVLLSSSCSVHHPASLLCSLMSCCDPQSEQYAHIPTERTNGTHANTSSALCCDAFAKQTWRAPLFQKVLTASTLPVVSAN